MREDRNIKRTPTIWELMDNISVLDHDGWRYDHKSWYEPITRAEWIKRRDRSTIKGTMSTNNNKAETCEAKEKKMTQKGTTEYYKQAIDIVASACCDLGIDSPWTKIVVNLAKTSPKTLVDTHNDVVPRNTEQGLIDEINTVYDGDNKIACIKRYRELTGAGLQDSKDWVEKHFF